MAHGTLTLNGVTDKQLIKIIEIKDKSAGKLNFNPNSPIGQTGQPQPNKPELLINNVVLQFSEKDGAKFAAELFQMLAE